MEEEQAQVVDRYKPSLEANEGGLLGEFGAQQG